MAWGTKLACLEMALSGITTYTDMYYFEDIVAQTTKEAGIRGGTRPNRNWLPRSRL